MGELGLSGDSPKTYFSVQVHSSDDYLTLSEIWPDGNAPENPTAEDVMAEIRKSGSVSSFISDWNMELFVEVDGKDVKFR